MKSSHTFLIFLNIIMLLSLNNLWAQRPNIPNNYYPYQEKKITIRSANFRRYVIPQMKALNQEFYHIIKKLSPNSSLLIKHYENLIQIENSFNLLKEKCQREDLVSCKGQLQVFYQLLRQQDQFILESLSTLNKRESLLDLGMDKVQGFLQKTSIRYFNLLRSSEIFHIVHDTGNSPFYLRDSGIGSEIDRIKILSEMVLFELLEPKLRTDFEACWNHFIKKMQQKIIFAKNSDFLIARLEELNLSWNTFHMKMTKGNHKLPKNITKTIKIMHNRWNSVLKILLNS